MKKRAPLLVFSVIVFFTGCADEKQTTVVHHTHVVHHTNASNQGNAPANDSPDNFEAVERPATYSH